MLNLGIIGLGAHGSRVWLNASTQSRHFQNIALLGRAFKKLGAINASDYNIKPFPNYDLLLNDKSVNAVVISLPNNLHEEYILKALQHGKHVLCEKPLCLSGKSAQKINDAKINYNKIVVEGFMYRFHPLHKKVLALIKQGKLGKVTHISVNYTYYLDDYSNIRLKENNAGGVLNDIGCYALDYFFFLRKNLGLSYSNTVNHLQGKSVTDKAHAVDIFTQFEVEFSDGMTCKASLGCKINDRCNSIKIQGTAGTIVIPKAFHLPRNMSPVIHFFPNQTKQSAKTSIRVAPANHFLIQLEAFALLVAGHKRFGNYFNNFQQQATLLEKVRNQLCIK